ncbi:hypothetical protein GE21DRAFT_1131219 [Neurospora crassa]|nr:hypothetical protein GE21DRAFT_1131219 [Neurospora crassa]
MTCVLQAGGTVVPDNHHCITEHCQRASSMQIKSRYCPLPIHSSPSRLSISQVKLCHHTFSTRRTPTLRLNTTRPAEHIPPVSLLRSLSIFWSYLATFRAPPRLFVESTNRPGSPLKKRTKWESLPCLLGKKATIGTNRPTKSSSVFAPYTRSPLAGKGKGQRRCPALLLLGFLLDCCSPAFTRCRATSTGSSSQKTELPNKPTAREKKGRERGREREKEVRVLLREKKNLVLPPPNQCPSLASRVDDHAANYLTSSGPLTKQ